jgi:hypothetical protein
VLSVVGASVAPGHGGSAQEDLSRGLPCCGVDSIAVVLLYDSRFCNPFSVALLGETLNEEGQQGLVRGRCGALRSAPARGACALYIWRKGSKKSVVSQLHGGGAPTTYSRHA